MSINIKCINEKKNYMFSYCDKKCSRPKQFLHPPADCKGDSRAHSMGNSLL